MEPPKISANVVYEDFVSDEEASIYDDNRDYLDNIAERILASAKSKTVKKP
ncbi:hypothetical protein ACVL91_001015 [Bradyrhizobium elkanii]|uniref:Uncharacterized protein n=1 Tax=Bradyrhizobium elkanii TaxID=29448 RepID=A0A8I2C6Y6_BRAEL|nr:hypothetical protein [Bradyrhizobium elkanii]